ncbi:MAG: ATP-dependent HslUV protease ATP-binding subunit HslU [Bacillota bacterium]|nr:ATP-dependent HslUV protease ATP-binding subunit HslU [Bacillota bacterium]
MIEELRPRAIVEELDKYIVGQAEAKRIVAIALRNRYRRAKLPPELRDEIIPKNILMIGPTGVGKTEIARRLAKLVNAPLVKVEATKFTEVGYVGRDVDAMIRDLVETAIRMVKAERMAQVQAKAAELAEEKLLDLLAPLPERPRGGVNPLGLLFGVKEEVRPEEENYSARLSEAKARRLRLKEQLAAGELEDQLVEVEVEDNTPPMLEIFSGAGVEEMGINLQEVLGNIFPKRRKKRRVTVENARRILTQEEAQKLIDMDEVIATAIERAEQSGIVFIDEIDKIAGREGGVGPDVSREGVQRDILPIIEGCTVMTKYGPVKTDHILFIAAGAFHVAKPSDLIPELQGRFPLRVELKPLTEEDFRRILTQPENALIKQYSALLETEGIKVKFSDDAIEEIAKTATLVNEQTENIGARRLHTILEKVLEDISFTAGENGPQEVVIDAGYVRRQLESIVKNRDLSRYIL